MGIFKIEQKAIDFKTHLNFVQRTKTHLGIGKMVEEKGKKTKMKKNKKGKLTWDLIKKMDAKDSGKRLKAKGERGGGGGGRRRRRRRLPVQAMGS